MPLKKTQSKKDIYPWELFYRKVASFKIIIKAWENI
jgi:hypothetical protein